MTWKLIFSNSARRNLRKLPLNDRRRINRALDELALDPALGDVLPLRNHPAEFRKRVGDYRIFFDVVRDERLVRVHAIVRRTSTTYRRRWSSLDLRIFVLNGPGQICFEFRKGHAYEVEIVDYHKG